MKNYIAITFLIIGFISLIGIANFYHKSKAITKKPPSLKPAKTATIAPLAIASTQLNKTPEASSPEISTPAVTPEKLTPVEPPALPETFGIVKLNLCNYLTLSKTDEAGITSIYSLSGKRRDNGTACAMVITVMDLSSLKTNPESNQLSLDQFIKVMLNGQKQNQTIAKESNIESQKINNNEFKKITWESSDKSKGMIYAVKNGNYYVALTARDISPFSDETLPKCEKIINSFAFNKDFAQAANE